MMRHSPPVRGFLPKAEERTSSLSVAVCTALHTRVKGGCLPGFRLTYSIVLGTAQFSRIGSSLPTRRTDTVKTMPHRAVSNDLRVWPQRCRFGIIRHSA